MLKNVSESNTKYQISEPAGHREARCVAKHVAHLREAFHSCRPHHLSQYDHQGEIHLYRKFVLEIEDVFVTSLNACHNALHAFRCGWTRQRTTTYSSFWKTSSQGLFYIHTFFCPGSPVMGNIWGAVLTNLNASGIRQTLKHSFTCATRLSRFGH